MDLDYEQIQDNVANGTAIVCDVRTAEEYAAGHADRAINVPLQLIQSGEFPDVNKSTKVYVYCRSGGRSAQAENILKRAGYENVTNLGGLGDVESMGAHIVK